MVLQRLEFLLAGRFELPRVRPCVIGVIAQGLTHVLFTPHSIPFLEPKSPWSFTPSSYVTSLWPPVTPCTASYWSPGSLKDPKTISYLPTKLALPCQPPWSLSTQPREGHTQKDMVTQKRG